MRINYKEKITAFIDVLGFSNLVYGNDENKLNLYFSFVIEQFSKIAKKHKFEYLIVSDAIIISANYGLEDFNVLTKVLNILQVKLLYEGILIRGGISSGKLFIDKERNIVVGPGMINAYKLELSANYPRIIIDRKLITEFYKNTNDAIKNGEEIIRYEPPIPYTSDYIYLDYCRGFSLTQSRAALSKALKNFKASYYLNEHIQKYEWLKRHLISGFEVQMKYLVNKENKTKNERHRFKSVTLILEELKEI